MELEVLIEKMKNKEKVYHYIEALDIKEEIDFADDTWYYEIVQLFGDAAEYQLGRWFALDVGGRADIDDLDSWYWIHDLKEF